MNETVQTPARRHRKRRILAWLLLALLVLPLAALTLIATTESGLRWAVAIAQSALGEQLQVERIDGRLIGPLHMQGFQFRHSGGEISLGTLELDWTPRKLFFNHVSIEVLKLADLRVVNSAAPAASEPASKPGEFVLDVQLPGDLSLANASLINFEYQDTTQQQRLDRLLLSAYTRDNQVFIETLQVDADRSTASASGRLALTPRNSTELTLNWQVDLPEQQQLNSRGTLSVDGKPDNYHFNGNLSLQSMQIPAGSWQLAGDGNLTGLTLTELRGETLDGLINASGKLLWQPELRWDIALAVQQIDPGKQWTEWPGRLSAQLSSDGSYVDGKPDLKARLSSLDGRLREHVFTADADIVYRDNQLGLLLNWTLNEALAAVLASRGRLTVEGTPEAYRFDTEATLQSPEIPAGNWRATGHGSQQALTLESLQGALLDGTVNGSGEIGWAPEVRWDVSLASQQLNPARHWPEWPGRLSGELASAGSIIDDTTDLSARLTGLDGELRGYPIKGDADIALKGDTLSVNALALQSGSNHLTASGSVGEQIALDWQLDAADLSAVLPDWRGAAALSGKLFGSRAEPGVQASIAVNKVSGPQLEVQAVQGVINLQQSNSAQQSVELQADGVLFQGRRFEHTTLNVSGTLPQHQIDLSTRGGEASARIEARGGWQDPAWRGRLASAEWNTLETGPWTLERPVSLVLSKQQVQVADGCWQQDATRVCLDIDGDPAARWKAETRLQQLPMAFFNRLLDRPLQWDSSVTATLRAEGSAAQLQTASLQAGISSGTLRLERPEGPLEERIAGMDLNAALDTSGVDTTLHLGLAGQDYVDARLQLPGYQPQTSAWQQQELALTLQGKLRELALLHVLLEDIGTFTGQIDIDMRGRGTLGKPLLAGDINVQNGKLGINQLGIELDQLQLALKSSDEALQLHGGARSGDGHLNIDGELAFTDIAHWKAGLQLQGKDFELVHIPEALVLISPDLNIDIAPAEIRVNGKLHIPSTRLKPRQLPNAVTASKDVIIIEPEQQAPVEQWKVYSQVQLSLGDDVRLDGFGVKGHLTGKLNLRDEPQRVTTGRGKLGIEKGTYTAFGRELNLVKGQLLFSDGPVDNPGLDFKAERVVGDVHAGVRVRGTLKEPELDLYSDPALSDADILSYITIGRPAAQAGQGGGSASDALAMATGNLLAENIGESLGLEEFRVASSGSLEEASLVLGTYLSPQLYVRYSAGLYETASQFEAIYELNKNWSVRTQTSVDESAADIVFSFER